MAQRESPKAWIKSTKEVEDWRKYHVGVDVGKKTITISLSEIYWFTPTEHPR
jgi:hypothetical protein